MSQSKSFYSVEEPKTLVLCSYVIGVNTWDPTDYFNEFKSLVKTAGIKPTKEVFLKLRMMDSGKFFTKGKLEEIVAMCSADGIEQIVLSSSLTGTQNKNIESATSAKVIDRTDLILKIFKNSAISAEGKLQVEIAEISIAKTKVAGIGKEMAQQQFGVGSRGPGETEKEFLMRHYSEEIFKAEKKLASLAKTRAVQRKRRLQCGLPLISLVGYTNAGKSSILNAISEAEVLAEDKLFATLDTTTKEVFLAPGKKALISDTVGFISELPHHLIRAFRSTLEELAYAELLLHVIDISNSSWQDQVEVVEKTLKEINVNIRMVYVFNKIDKVSEETIALIKSSYDQANLETIFVSTKNYNLIQPLKQFLTQDNKIWSHRPIPDFYQIPAEDLEDDEFNDK